jgi:hypothetical protein
MTLDLATVSFFLCRISEYEKGESSSSCVMCLSTRRAGEVLAIEVVVSELVIISLFRKNLGDSDDISGTARHSDVSMSLGEAAILRVC